jgi:hypothetical protein
MAERREKPGPAAGLALSRMTVRPPLASSPCLPWTLSVQHVLALSSEELSYAYRFHSFSSLVRGKHLLVREDKRKEDAAG